MNSDEQQKEHCNCNEANSYCDKAQYNEAELWEQTKLQLHLTRCPYCQQYTMKNKRLTSLLNKAELNVLSPLERQALREELERELRD